MSFKKALVFLCVPILVAAAGLGGLYYSKQKTPPPVEVSYKTPEEKDKYVRFDMEAFDTILQNYWKQATSSDLAGLFLLSAQKATNNDKLTLPSQDRSGTATMLAKAFSVATSSENEKQFALGTLAVALYNLAPAGRSGLLSQKQEVALRQNVSNINPGKDLYQDLGVAKGAAPAAVEAAYTEKKTELAHATSSEAKAQLQQVTYAHKVLTDNVSKNLYDQGQIEPTVFSHVTGKTLYLDLSKISPTTLQEFAMRVDEASTTNLNNMIIDVRSNVGGALDFVSFFLGLFMGQNQFAFDLFHQGNYQVQRTTTPVFPELARYGEIAILTDNMSQSTAELLAATFKRFHLAHVVGGTTRGWGSVENTYPLTTSIAEDEKYSLLLVNSLTLRDDNQPIEGRGVDPDVNIADPAWKSNLSKYFNSADMIAAVKAFVTNPPLH